MLSYGDQAMWVIPCSDRPPVINIALEKILYFLDSTVLISQYSLYIASGFMVNVRTSFGQRPSYQCPSMFCDTPMVHHIRRFVHGQGCVQIILKELDSPVPGYQHTILTYSWCRICKQVNMPCCYSISYNIIYFFICIVLFGRGGLCYFGFICN